MSDGMLRFLAFVCALLQAPAIDAKQAVGGAAGPEALRTLVIEEIENGLHPSQAARAVELIKEECLTRQIRTIATTHSPALLNAVAATEHRGVLICDRDPDTGLSRVRRLVDMPSYPRAMAEGTLGEAVTTNRLAMEPSSDGSVDQLEALLAEL
jgi:predicted ATPase